MLHSLVFKDVGPAAEMRLDFTPRLNLLTGDNGLGKTFVLDAIWWVMTGRWATIPALPRTDAKVENLEGSRVLSSKIRALIGAKDTMESVGVNASYSADLRSWI